MNPFGLAMGIVLGTAMGNPALGIALGVSFGMMFTDNNYDGKCDNCRNSKYSCTCK